MATIGSVYENLGLYREARPLLEKALEIRRQVLGNDDSDLVASLVYLGRVSFADLVFIDPPDTGTKLEAANSAADQPKK